MILNFDNSKRHNILSIPRTTTLGTLCFYFLILLRYKVIMDILSPEEKWQYINCGKALIWGE